jgi:hypothetical protein
MPARRNGKNTAVDYAQVGMFRRWLGDLIGWWGIDDPEFPARTYAGDNYLSARIWELGYTVDAVDGVNVRDLVHEDELRLINGGSPDQPGNHGHRDTQAFYQRFPGGVMVADAPVVEQQNKTQLRVLYLPIFEPGWAVQKEQKQGLRNALMKKAWVQEVDYLAIDRRILIPHLLDWVERFRPHMIISQIHDPHIFSPDDIQMIRSYHPSMVWVNWNGDVYEDGLVSHDMLRVLQTIDLQLVVNAGVLHIYEQAHIPAAYWQIGWESADQGTPRMDMVLGADVVFLGNAYDDPRRALYDAVKELDCSSTFYGDGWAETPGSTLYDFATGAAIINRAKIVLSDNMWNRQGFVSNRLFQSMSAGGALLLQQHVPGLQELTGLVNGKHYVEWNDLHELKALITFYLKHEDQRVAIANAGTKYVRRYHSFDARVKQLIPGLLQKAKRQPRTTGSLRYVGPRTTPFGVKIRSNKYTCTPGDILHVDPLDMPSFLQQPELWEKVETGASMQLMGGS